MQNVFFIGLSFLFLTACNFVQLQRRVIERSIERRSLIKKEIQLGSDKITYWEGGLGPNLLLLHGFGADGTFGWAEQIPAFSKKFHLIIPDLLWFGDSQSSQKDFSVQHQSRAVLALLQYLGIKHYSVAGISYGGIVAFMLMSEDPESIQKSVIIASPGPVYTHKDYEQMKSKFQVQSASEIVLPDNKEGLDRLLEIAYRRPPYVPLLVRQNVIDFLKDRPAGEKTALLDKLLQDFNKTQFHLKRFHGKTLIVWGQDDALFPVQLAEKLKSHLGAQAELKIIPMARHAPNIEYARDFNKIVLKFLSARH